MITENSVTYQFVGNVNHVPVLEQNVANLPEGAVAFVNGSGTIVAAGEIAAGTQIRVAQKINGQLVFSPFFTRGTSTVVTQTYVAPVEQITYLGYNGTGGQLDDEDGREYSLDLYLNHTQGVFNNTPMIKSVPAWVAPQAAGTASGTKQYLLASALVDSLNRQFRRSPSQSVKGEIVCNNAGTALGTGVDTLTFTAGSKYFTATDIDDATVNAALAVGDLIRLGTGVTDPVYKVVAIDTVNNVGTLDLPVATSSTGLDPAYERIPAASIGAAVFGVKFTGVTTSIKDPVSETPAQVNFKVTFDKILNASDNGILPQVTATIVTTTPSKEGIGTGAKVAVKEIYTTMNEGQPQVCAYPPTKYRKAALLTANYHQKVISSTNDAYVSQATGQKPVSKFNIIIAVNTTLNGTAWAAINTQVP
jgi:hypothetical protein